MKPIRRINFRFAIKAILWISSFTVLFHMLIIAEVIPYEIVWGGLIEDYEQLQLLEIISIVVNLLIISVVAMKGGYLKPFLPDKAISILLWGFFILFSLNTAGNIFSTNLLETIIFTPLTLLLAILFLRIAVEDQRTVQPEK